MNPKAIARMSIGTLSDSERELLGPAPSRKPSRDLLEQLLHQHLHDAQQARLRMEAAKSWSPDYHTDFMKRENAIARAREHYQALRDLGAVDSFLERMAMTEGLQQ